MRGRVEMLAGALTGVLAAWPATAADPVDIGFLEFLGTMVEEDGVYYDPLDMADVALPDPPVDAAPESGQSPEENGP